MEKVIPVEPTKEMIDAAMNCEGGYGWREIWSAMIAAAPVQPTTAVPESGLRECPCCSSNNVKRWVADTTSVMCHDCGILVRCRTEKEAVAAWNTRAPSSAQGVTTVGDSGLATELIEAADFIEATVSYDSPRQKRRVEIMRLAATRLQSTGGAK